MNKISVIVAARNEAGRIEKVLSVLCDHPQIEEVIVVADGCSDNTPEIARSYHCYVDEEKAGLGKTQAVKKGITLAKTDIVALIDADLTGLTKEHFSKLAEPVISGKVEMTLSLRQNSALIYKLLGIDFVSGERVIRKDLLTDPLIWSKSTIGYSLEVLMNKSILIKKKKFLSIKLLGLSSIRKSAKTRHYWEGAISDIKMIFKIFQALPFYEVIWQFIKMAWLNRRYHRIYRKKFSK